MQKSRLPHKPPSTIHSTLYVVAVYSPVITWTVHQATITVAAANAAIRAASLLQWAWAAPGILVLGCALAYSLMICFLTGTTAAIQIMRGCATEA